MLRKMIASEVGRRMDDGNVSTVNEGATLVLDELSIIIKS
jgi:hypothetical protein